MKYWTEEDHNAMKLKYTEDAYKFIKLYIMK